MKLVNKYIICQKGRRRKWIENIIREDIKRKQGGTNDREGC